MDTQTPQVLIEAKVVEASEEFTKSMAGQLGFSRINSDGRGNAGGFNGAPVTTGLSGTAFSATAQGKGGLIGYSPSLAFLPTAIDRLNLFIQMQETQENAKVISSPKTVVLNKKTAKTLKGTPTSIFEQISTPGGTTTTQRVVQAELSLEVKPTVTNAGSVLMALKINRDTVLNNLVAPRNINTEVLVDSGNTLVIGGIFTSDENRKSNGFPVLRDLPIIGWFFGGKSNTQNRSELFIFVTPRILESVEQQKMLSLPQEGGEAIPQDAG
jgi:type IV pilus assembly protein PilQ